jgi:hypothetical protein
VPEVRKVGSQIVNIPLDCNDSEWTGERKDLKNISTGQSENATVKSLEISCYDKKWKCIMYVCEMGVFLRNSSEIQLGIQVTLVAPNFGRIG